MPLQVADILAEAVGHLLDSRNPQGHWGDVRSTALATWALSDLLRSGEASQDVVPEIRRALSDSQVWLSGQARREERGVSWESEAWDTSLATIALSANPAFSDRVEQAATWLQYIRYEGTGCWYDEVWETTLATVALLRAERLRKGPPGQARWIEEVLRWLVQIPSKETGEFICPHYSGFIAWLLAEIEQTRLATPVTTTEAFQTFKHKVDRTVQWLVQQLGESPCSLWSNYTFSNAYIGYGLSLLSRSQRLGDTFAVALIDWLRRRQGGSGGFEDTEDTAAVIIVLSSLLHHDPAETRPLFARLSRSSSLASSQSQQLFLGYSSQAKPIADSIIAFFRSHLPQLSFKNWIWDFQPGTNLFDQIESASRECRAAVFLVTRDDTVLTTKGWASAPRDNIVFEAGFFAARLGVRNTILLVEEGAKIPTDLGGILFIPLKDRNSIDAACSRLERALREICRIDRGLEPARN